MTTTIKIQARGVLTLPKKVRTRMGIDAGDMVELVERDGKVFITPVSHIDSELQEDIRSALEDLRTGNHIDFSTIGEFHEKRKAKWGKK